MYVMDVPSSTSDIFTWLRWWQIPLLLAMLAKPLPAKPLAGSGPPPHITLTSPALAT